MPSTLVKNTEQYVKDELSINDASHDFAHIDRVRKLALHLGKLEGLGDEDRLLIEVAALLHDIRDWKYVRDGQESASQTIQAFLSGQQQSEDFIQKVIDVVECVGFKEELDPSGPLRQLTAPAAIVQDADRLDAIGAIGIARCFTFGGSRHRVMHDPSVAPRLQLSKAAYMESSYEATTINHFYEKLLKIKGLMKTKSGLEIAEQRHAFMQAYLDRFMLEWEGLA